MTRQKTQAAETLLEADRRTHEKVRPYRHSAPVKALSLLSELGDQPQMLTLSGGILAFGLFRGERRLTRAGARMIAAHLLATGIKNFVKRRVDRTRPFAANGEADHKPRLGRDDSKEETSFPSGHSAGALAVAQAFARELPEYRAAALGGAGLIALAQVPRCAHYPTDVGAGLAIGWLSEVAVDRGARLLLSAVRG
ncbi:MAG TPA: phosphatase PAP2 family protein [Allosphingosinicella sp.]|jgi:membrane-associated phospholipid phosphatase